METPDHPETIEDQAPTPPRPTSKRSALLGAVLGMTALAGTIVGVGAIASAQDEPIPESSAEPVADDGDGATSMLFDADFEAFEACMAEQLGDLWLEPEVMFGELDDLELDEVELLPFEEVPFDEFDEQAFVDAEQACNDLLPEEVKAEIEAWRPYEECIDGRLGDLPDPWEEGDTEPDEAAWESFDAAWEAADAACRDLLPAEAQAEMAAWDAFDECLTDAGVFDDEFDVASTVHIETGDGFQVVEFGAVDGSVTISGTDGDLTVVASGGATVIDEDALDARWAEFDEAHAACEELLPEDAFGEFEVFEGEMFDGEAFEEGDLDD
jgi:hypothetical protein